MSEYVSQCVDSSTVAVKEHVDRDIFNFDFNLSSNCLGPTLVRYVIKQPQLKAKAAYYRLKQDRPRAQDDPSLNTIAFNLQQALPTPMIPTEIVFNMRQLWTYNLGVHNCSDELATMMMWPEIWHPEVLMRLPPTS